MDQTTKLIKTSMDQNTKLPSLAQLFVLDPMKVRMKDFKHVILLVQVLRTEVPHIIWTASFSVTMVQVSPKLS